MKRIPFIILCFTSFVFSSCNRDDIVSKTDSYVKSIIVTAEDFEAGELGTRSNYYVDADGFHFTWAEGDTVGIYPIGADQVAFPLSSGDGNQSALFDGGAWALRSTYSYAAYFPFSVENYKKRETAIPVSFLGQSQNGNGSLSNLGKYDFQASTASKPDQDGNVSITLKHLGCFVRVQLTMPVADTFTSLTLSSSKGKFVTNGTFDLSADTPAITSTQTSSSMTVTLKNVSTTEANQSLTVYLMSGASDLSTSTITATVAGVKNPSYTATFTGRSMTAGKAYSYTASCQGISNNPSSAAVTGSVTGITAVSATMQGYANNVTHGNGNSAGICYSSTNATPTISDATLTSTSLDSENSFFVTARKLEPGTTYYYRAYVNNGGITRYASDVYNFTTPSTDGIVSTESATDITAVSATVAGSHNLPSSAYNSLEYGVCYSTTNQEPTVSDFKAIASTISNGSFNVSLKVLESNTRYYWRAYIIVDGRTIYSSDVCNFTTPSTYGIVTTGDASDITSLRATVAGSFVLPSTSYGSIQCGICYSSANSVPTILDSKFTATTVSDGTFYVILQNLNYDTRYYYRAFITVDGQTIYGEPCSFTTSVASASNVAVTGTIASPVEKSNISVTCIANIDNIIFSTITIGVCWSTTNNPTPNDNIVTVQEIDADGKYEIMLTKLKYNTTFYYRAYVKTDIDIYYGEVKSFQTAKYCRCEYVDLGLSVKWATCNLGADNPEEYGDYFAWGETEFKTVYSWEDYKYHEGNGSYYLNQTKYNYNKRFGTVDNKIVLDSEDDAAIVNWCGDWRMPTKDEFDELCNTNNCNWTWYESGNTEFVGIAGYKVTSKKSGYEGNFIFLPAAGYIDETHHVATRSCGRYWSSSLFADYKDDPPISAYGLGFTLNEYSIVHTYRRYGLLVRPVFE